MRTTRIYLDNAATSWPKPDAVYDAVERTQRELGAAAGRGSYPAATDVQRIVDQTRHMVAQMIHADGPQNIVFTYSGTDSLCTAMLGLLRDGDHVVTSTAEHNSVLRPLRHLESQHCISVTRVGCDLAGGIDSTEIIQAIRPDTRLIALSHVSNVTGAIQPLEAIGSHCQQQGITFLVDAAQSLGHLPIDVRELGCHILAAPGHKGLLGPLGTGVLYIARNTADEITPLRFGGTGSTYNSDEQPNELPEKFEAGNLNVAGIAGMGAGIRFLQSEQARERAAIAEELKHKLLAGILEIAGLTLHGPQHPEIRTGVFSISFRDIGCHEAASILDSAGSVQVRSGFHCAPLLHRNIGTEDIGGTVRLSLGLFNKPEHVDIASSVLAQIASG